METSSLEKINYRPSDPAKKILRSEKKKFPRKSFNQMIDESIIRYKEFLKD